jgi:tetratricopeptide (TPR) repeat protein
VLGLGATAAALTCIGGPGLTAGAFGLAFVGGTAGNIAGNLATELFKDFDRAAGERWFDRFAGIDQNHVVLLELRLAHLRALRATVDRFEARPRDEDHHDDRARQQAEDALIRALRAICATEEDEARQLAFGLTAETPEEERRVRTALLQALPDALDTRLADRRHPRADAQAAEAVRSLKAGIEAAALDELRALLARLETQGEGVHLPLPDDFVTAFRGRPGEAGGWFHDFILEAVERLRSKPEFSTVWQAEQLSAVKALAEVQGKAIAGLATRVDRLASALADLPAAVEQMRANTAEILRLMTELRMQRGYRALRPDAIARKPTAMIVADYGLIPFDDSRGLLGSLEDPGEETLLGWMMGGDDVRVRLVHAAGGQGKTRLALEAVARLNASGLGWQAGLLGHAQLEAALAPGTDRLAALLARRGTGGIFIAIDYAETRQDQLRALAAVLEEAPEGGPIRVLLLARTDSWWRECLQGMDTARRLPFEETAIAADFGIAPPAIPAFFEAACGAFAARLAQAPRRAGEAGLVAADWRARPVEPGAGGSPLDLAIRAYLRVRGIAIAVSPLATLADDERTHLRRALRGTLGAEPREPVARLATQGAAGLTLLGGLSAAQGEAALQRLVGLAADRLGRPVNEAEREAVFDALRLLHGGPDGTARPILPDLLGERIVGEVLAEARDLLPALFDAFPEDSTIMLVGLNRISRLHPDGGFVHDAVQVVTPARDALRAALAPRLERVTFAGAVLFAAQAETGTLQDDLLDALRGLGAASRGRAARAVTHAAGELVSANAAPVRLRGVLGAIAAEAGVARGAEDGLPDAKTRAREADNRGILLSNAGRRAEALAAGEEAVTLVRELAAKNRDAFLPDLASALNNLGIRYSDLGRREEALAASEEAVTLHRELVAKNRDAFLPNLAGALNNLGNRYSNLGRREDALAASEEAATLRRELVAKNRDAFLPDLAGALNNLGIRYSDLGRREEALAASEEAVTLHRELVAKNRDAFLPDLAGALNNLGGDLSRLGRREEALAASEEAVPLHRELVAKNRDAFLPDLAMALNNLGAVRSKLDRREEALAASEEAVTLRRELVAKNRGASLPDLASALTNLGVMRSHLGRREEALAASEEAVTLRKELVAKNRDAFLPNLASALTNLGVMRSNLGRREEALAASEEAVTLHRELVAKNRDAFLPDLASALTNLGVMRSHLGRREEALAASEEAVTLHRELVAKNRDAFLPDLAGALNNLGNRYSDLGRREEALAASEEAVTLHRELVAKNRDAFLPDLAGALNNLGGDLSRLGRREEALAASEEAVTLHRELVAKNRDAFLSDLAGALNNLGAMRSDLGRREEALAASAEAVTLRRELVAKNRDAFLPDLVTALGGRGQALLAAGEADDAAACFLEGARALRPLAAAHPAAFGQLLQALLKDCARALQAAGREGEVAGIQDEFGAAAVPAGMPPALQEAIRLFETWVEAHNAAVAAPSDATSALAQAALATLAAHLAAHEGDPSLDPVRQAAAKALRQIQGGSGTAPGDA